MKTLKKLARDDFGYINGRGRSQYWGVTVGVDGNGRDFWVVSYKPANGGETHSLRAAGFTLKEVDAAKIAAAIYETGQLKERTVKLKVLSADKKFVFNIRGTDVWRETFTNQAVHEPAPILTLEEAVVPKRRVGRPRKEASAETNAKLNIAAKGENAYVAKLANMILGGNLSNRSSKALIAVLESTQKPVRAKRSK